MFIVVGSSTQAHRQLIQVLTTYGWSNKPPPRARTIVPSRFFKYRWVSQAPKEGAVSKNPSTNRAQRCLTSVIVRELLFLSVTFADSYLSANIEFRNKACTRGKYYLYTGVHFLLFVFIYVYRHIYVRHVLAVALATSLP